MITQNIQFTINCNTGETVSWVISSSNPCVTFNQLSGTATGTTTLVNVIATFADEDCFVNSTITITTTDESGVVTTKQINFQNPCENLSTFIGHQPTLDYPHSLIAVAIGGNPSYSYQWSFDSSLFEAGGSLTNDVLLLRVKDGVALPDTSTVSVNTVDSKGCQETKAFTLSLYPPLAQFVRIRSVDCMAPVVHPSCGTVNQVASQVRLEAVPYNGKSIDWGTLVVSLPAGFCIADQQIPFQGANYMLIAIYSNDLPNAEYIGSWSVADEDGIRSNVATLYVGVPECALTSVVHAEPTYYQVSLAELTPGTEIEIDLEAKIHPRECCETAADADFYPDWDTFTFVATPLQTLVTPVSLTATNGAAVLTFDRKLKYTVGAMPACDVDLIQFTVDNKAGGKSNMGKVVFDYERRAAPVTVADSACVVCGEFATIDVLANDTGDINPSTVMVTSTPSKGTFSIGTDGVISFRASDIATGADSIQYKVANPDGEFSSVATVTLTIICAGRSPVSLGNKCKTTIDLESFLASYATAGGTWSASLANPSVVSLVNPAAVDFSAATAGDYIFSYSVTSGLCTARVDINLTLISAPANNACAGALVMSYPAAIGLRNTLFTQGITECTTDSAVALPAGWYGVADGDVWFTFTTNAVVGAKIIVDGVPFIIGLTNPQIAVYSGNCGALVAQASASINDGSRALELPLPVLTAATQYWVRVSGGVGQFNVSVETS